MRQASVWYGSQRLSSTSKAGSGVRTVIADRRCRHCSTVLGGRRRGHVDIPEPGRQFVGVRLGGRGAEGHHDSARLAGRQHDYALERGTRVETGTARPGERALPEAGGRVHAPVAAEELAPVRRVAGDRLAQRAERDVPVELRIEVVPGEQCAQLRIERGTHVVLRSLALRAERPFNVRGQPDAPFAGVAIRDRSMARRTGSSAAMPSVRRVAIRLRSVSNTDSPAPWRTVYFESCPSGAGVALHVAGRLVLQVQYVGDRVTDGIVVPRRQAEEVAAIGPGAAGTALADDEPAALVRNDIGPRRGGQRVAGDANHVVAVPVQPADPVVEHEFRTRRFAPGGMEFSPLLHGPRRRHRHGAVGAVRCALRYDVGEVRERSDRRRAG
jgi:hypothetical protein